MRYTTAMKFSIVTCTYNSGKFLAANLQSVQAQTFTDYEHVFIDGESTDNTRDLIAEYAEQQSAPVRVVSAKPQGIAHAMNRGIAEASGEFIVHLHGDDQLASPDTLATVHRYSEEYPTVDWFYGKAVFQNIENNTERIIPHRSIYHRISYPLLLLTNYLPHQATYMRKRVFEQYGTFSEEYRSSMDYELWVRLAQQGVSAKFIDEVLCLFAVHAEAQSQTGSKDEHLRVFDHYVKNPLARGFLKTVHNINKKRTVI